MKMKKLSTTILFSCLTLLMAVCLSACQTSKAPVEPIEPIEEPTDPTPQEEVVNLERGQQLVSDLGLTVSIDDFAYSDDGNMSILIEGTVKNTSDKDISLMDAMSVSVIQNGLVCEGMPREDVGLTKGIGFHDTIAAGAEEKLMDVVCTIEAMAPIEVKIYFSDGKIAVWKM